LSVTKSNNNVKNAVSDDADAELSEKNKKDK